MIKIGTIWSWNLHFVCRVLSWNYRMHCIVMKLKKRFTETHTRPNCQISLFHVGYENRESESPESSKPDQIIEIERKFFFYFSPLFLNFIYIFLYSLSLSTLLAKFSNSRSHIIRSVFKCNVFLNKLLFFPPKLSFTWQWIRKCSQPSCPP